MTERKRFHALAQLPSSCFSLVRQKVQLEGYSIGVVKDLALDTARQVACRTKGVKMIV